MLREALIGSAAYLVYWLTAVAVLLCARRLFGLGGELFRKLLHIIVASSVFVLLNVFDTWWLAALAPVGFGAAVYLVIGWAERIPRVMRILEERKPGEIRSSLSLIFFTLATLIALGWGWLGPESKYMVSMPVMMWGLGDAAAALIGKKWGRRKITHPWVDNSKTVEGVGAMLVFAAAAGSITLLAYSQWSWYLCVLVGIAVAPVAAVTELVSRGGIDTLTVPFATFAALLVVVKALTFASVL